MAKFISNFKVYQWLRKDVNVKESQGKEAKGIKEILESMK
jgi:hypothetical protein